MRLAPFMFWANIWANKVEGAGSLKQNKDRQIIKVSPQPSTFLTTRPWPRFLIIAARKVGAWRFVKVDLLVWLRGK
jgi:hypothetical protein